MVWVCLKDQAMRSDFVQVEDTKRTRERPNKERRLSL